MAYFLFSAGKRSDRAIRYLAYLLIALAVLSGFSYVYNYGVNVYWGDDWGTLPQLFERHAAGTLEIAKFWEFRNEHRIVFPKLAMFGLGLLTHGNAVANMYLTQFLFLAILAVFIAGRRERLTSGLAVWLMVPVAFLVFSFRQWENMLASFQVAFVMPVAAALIAFLCLGRMKDDSFVALFTGAVLSATLAAYSALHGLLVWPVGLGQLLIVPLSKRRKIVLVAVWMAVGSAEWLLYFIGYVKPAYHPHMGFSCRYLLVALGATLFDNVHCREVMRDCSFFSGRCGDPYNRSLDGVLPAVVLVGCDCLCSDDARHYYGRPIGTWRGPGGIVQICHAYDSVGGCLYLLFLPRRAERLRLAGIILAIATVGLAIFGASGYYLSVPEFGRAMWMVRLYDQTAVCTIRSQSAGDAATHIRSPTAPRERKHAGRRRGRLGEAEVQCLLLTRNCTSAANCRRPIFRSILSAPGRTRPARRYLRTRPKKWRRFTVGPLIGQVGAGRRRGYRTGRHRVSRPIRAAQSGGCQGAWQHNVFAPRLRLFALPISELGPAPRHTIFLKVLTRDRKALYLEPAKPATFETKDLYR